jgi:hypothetical protein
MTSVVATASALLLAACADAAVADLNVYQILKSHGRIGDTIRSLSKALLDKPGLIG